MPLSGQTHISTASDLRSEQKKLGKRRRVRGDIDIKKLHVFRFLNPKTLQATGFTLVSESVIKIEFGQLSHVRTEITL